MENELRLMINQFEKKIDEAEKEYQEQHSGNFSNQRMKIYVNRKFKNERETIIALNLMPSAIIISKSKATEKFKY